MRTSMTNFKLFREYSCCCLPEMYQVLRPQVQVQVLQTCTRVQLEYKYKY